MGTLVALAHTAEAPTVPASVTVIGPAGLSGAGSRAQRLFSRPGILATTIARRLGQRAVRAHLARDVHTEADRPRLVELVGQAYRYEGSIYALAATLRDYPLTDQQGLYSRVGRIGIPTLLLWGEHDAVTPRELMAQARTLLRATEAEVIASCGHIAPFEQPAVVAACLARFFQTVEAKA
jgi:pimeloyl-ACP methyl ester carboxylesterase